MKGNREEIEKAEARIQELIDTRDKLYRQLEEMEMTYSQAEKYRKALEEIASRTAWDRVHGNADVARAALSDTEETPSVEPMTIRDNPDLEAQLIRDHAEGQETDKTEENPLVTAAGQVC